jgi:hypothetical protein
MRGLRFQIKHLSGQVEGIDVEAERAMLGSGSHCEIRLPIDQARLEHLRIELTADGTVLATAVSFEPPPLLNGVAFTQGQVLPDSVLTVSQTQILIQAIDTTAGKSKAKKGSSPITTIGALVILAAGAFMLFSADEQEAAVKLDDQPDLFEGGSAATCPQQGPQALEQAKQFLNVASVKRERRPFFAQDGVVAVPNFERAAACFKSGADVNMAKYADGVAAYLRADLTRDYRKIRVGLDYHVRVKEYASAKSDVERLIAFIPEASPQPKLATYRVYLLDVKRRLQLRASREDVK